MKNTETILRKIEKNKALMAKFRNAKGLNPSNVKSAIKTLQALNRELKWVLN